MARFALPRLAVLTVAAVILLAGCGSDSSVSVFIPVTRTVGAGTTPTSPLPSATPTVAVTATATASATAIPPATRTTTPVATRTATHTPVPFTPTVTRAPATATASATVPAGTATAIASPTASATAPPSPTTTATHVPSATSTATAPPTTTSPTATGVPTGTAAATTTATASPSATASRAVTATFTPTATPTAGSGAVCGNRLLEPSETCTTCPADCVVGPCDSPGMPMRPFVVDLVPPVGFQPTTATVLLAYDSRRLSLPGSGTATTIRQRVVAPPPVPQAFTPNDLDYAVRVLVSRNVPLGTLFTATFDTCAGSTATGLGDVACTVEGCAAGGSPVPGCTCAVRLP